MTARAIVIGVCGIAILVILAGVVVAGTGGLRVGPVTILGPGDDPAHGTDPVTTSGSETTVDDDYWTEERMREAEPAPMPNPTAGDATDGSVDRSDEGAGGTQGGRAPGEADVGGRGEDGPDADDYEPAPMPNPTASDG